MTVPPVPPVVSAPVFVDEFNDLKNWQLYDSEGHDGQGVRSPRQISANGVLVISGSDSGRTGGMQLLGHPVTVGSRVDVRASAPIGAGVYHPVALLWGQGSGSSVDAVTGEIDFMEFWNSPNRDRVGFSLHYGDGYQMVSTEKDVTPGWHTYSVIWQDDSIKWLIDDVVKFQSNDKSKFPKVPMDLCIQLDYFPHEPTTKGSAVLYVDWVKIRRN